MGIEVRTIGDGEIAAWHAGASIGFLNPVGGVDAETFKPDLPQVQIFQSGTSAKPSFAAAVRSVLSKAATVRQSGMASAAAFALASWTAS